MKSKLYGVKEPKLVDYLFAIVLVLVSLAALWVGIWTTVTKTWDITNTSLQSFVDAISFNFQGSLTGVLAVESVLIYLGFATTFALCIHMLCKKVYRAIPGIIAIAISSLVTALGVGFFANFIGTDVIGVFIVVLAIIIIALMYTGKKTAKVSLTMMLCNCEDECREDCKCHEEKQQKEVKEEPKKEVKIEKEPETVNFAREFVFENSNGNDDTYREDFNKYNKQVREILEEENKDLPPFDRKENNYTFEQKLKMAEKVAKDYYKDLKKHFESLGFKSAMTKSGETFIWKNKKYAMIDVAGKRGLKVYFKLDFADYEETPIPVKDKSDVRKYENIPVLLVVKSNLAVKRAKKLMEDVKEKFGV